MRVIFSLMLLTLTVACAHLDETGRMKVVYFDTGKATIREDSLVTLKEIVDDYIASRYYGAPWKHDNCFTKFSKHCNDMSQSLVIVGHTDTVGNADYNMTLSKSRAEAVEAKLVELGVNSGVFRVHFKGENQPAVPTKDGVNEPLNRRSEVTIY